MLVLTPKPHPTECISGYLHTLCKDNRYKNPSWIIEPYRNGYHSDDYRRITPSTLCEIANLTLDEARRVCVRPDRMGDRSMLRLVGTELHVLHVDMMKFRICPCCVAQHGRHEAFWHLRLVEWCPIHRVRLLANCKKCGRELRWNRREVGRCNCGASLTTQVSSERCDERLADLLFVIRQALYGSEISDTEIPTGMTHLVHMDLYRLMRMIEVLGEMFYFESRRRGSGRTFPFGDKFCVSEHLPEVAKVLAPWPDSFQQFLHSTYHEELREDELRRSFRLTFPWAYYSLGKYLKEHAWQLSFLREEVMHFGTKYLTRDQLMRGNRIATKRPLVFRWGSVPEAAELLGIDPRTLLKRIHSGEVPAEETAIKLKNRNYKVDLEWARNQRARNSQRRTKSRGAMRKLCASDQIQNRTEGP